MQATSKKMLDEIRQIRKSLETNFQDANDGYARQMFRFSAVAEEEMQEVRDGIVQTGKLLRDVETYFGEGEEMGRPLPSQDFFGIFKTFTSSYKYCRTQNKARQEETMNRQRRAQARAALTPQPTGSSETDMIDARLQRLKLEGTPRIKREKRRALPSVEPIPASADFSQFALPTLGDGAAEVDYGTLAQKMMNDIFAVNGLEGMDANGVKEEPLSPLTSPSKRREGPTTDLADVKEEEEEEEEGDAESSFTAATSKGTSDENYEDAEDGEGEGDRTLGPNDLKRDIAT